MARPIRETPILYGGDARKFEQYEERMKHYHAVMSVFQG